MLAGGYLEQQYALKDILGDPRVPVLNCPLAIFCRSEVSELFDTPIINLVINLKW